MSCPRGLDKLNAAGTTRFHFGFTYKTFANSEGMTYTQYCLSTVAFTSLESRKTATAVFDYQTSATITALFPRRLRPGTPSYNGPSFRRIFAVSPRAPRFESHCVFVVWIFIFQKRSRARPPIVSGPTTFTGLHGRFRKIYVGIFNLYVSDTPTAARNDHVYNMSGTRSGK